jgi:hypothetical protein
MKCLGRMRNARLASHSPENVWSSPQLHIRRTRVRLQTQPVAFGYRDNLFRDVSAVHVRDKSANTEP